MIKRFMLLMLFPVLIVSTLIMSQSSVKNPHGELKWDCQDCHVTDSWSSIREDLAFDHNTTGFQLVGAHSSAACIGCHKDPVFSHVSTSCIDCHTDQHQGQLGNDCQKCHNSRDWGNQQNNYELHASRGFALVGAHTVADCEACHVGHAKQEYVGTPTDCYGCHSTDFNATDEPSHASLGFSTECQDCHSPSRVGWVGANFSHPISFPLTNGHRGVECQSCHPSGYTSTSTDCFSCHAPDFQSTSDPDHEISNFPHDCLQCHSTVGWQPANYDHNATSFPLTGAHIQAACIACHAMQFSGTPSACMSCHGTDFNQTAEPNHQLAQFDQNCLTCHTTTAWKPSSFNHATTGFLLTGQHTSALCSSCHATQYSGTATDCYSCHQPDFQGVTDPNHVAQGFSHDCTSCHATSGWIPSSFDHGATAFPLTGQHVTASCVSCHATGYSGTPTNCVSCHQSDFNTTTNPDHTAAAFPSSCQTCHTTNGWSPSTWDHDTQYFPINSGAHSVVACAECHTVPSTYTSFSCIDCHTHSKSVTDGHHGGVNNYQYLSSSCYTCHPRGKP